MVGAVFSSDPRLPYIVEVRITHSNNPSGGALGQIPIELPCLAGVSDFGRPFSNRTRQWGFVGSQRNNPLREVGSQQLSQQLSVFISFGSYSKPVSSKGSSLGVTPKTRQLCTKNVIQGEALWAFAMMFSDNEHAPNPCFPLPHLVVCSGLPDSSTPKSLKQVYESWFFGMGVLKSKTWN